MKSFAFFCLGILFVLCINATFEADITCHFIQQERLVRVQESANTDGMTKRVTDEIYIDRIFRGIVSNEVIYATNEIDSGIAKFKTVSVDPRRQQ
jgi:hypothetical protein